MTRKSRQRGIHSVLSIDFVPDVTEGYGHPLEADAPPESPVGGKLDAHSDGSSSLADGEEREHTSG